MKNILVTGGAGYIGSHMVYLLLKNGYNPIIIDNFSNSSDKNIKSLEKIFSKKIEVHNIDLKNQQDLLQLQLKDIDAVIHFAALKAVGDSVEKPIEYYENNVSGTINLLKWMKKNSVFKIIFSSTAAVYGMTDEIPLTEEFETNPVSPYAKSKLMVEDILKDSYEAYGINSVILRYFNVAGNLDQGEIGDLQKDPQNLIPALIMSHLGLKTMKLKVFGTDYPTRDGTGVRDYIHVLDLVNAHLKSLEYLQDNVGSHLFNLGTGTGTTVFEIIKAFENVTEEQLDYEIAARRAGDVIFSTCNPSKAKKLLGWKANQSLDQMISSMWNWYKYNYPIS